MALKRIDITHAGDGWVAKSGGQVVDQSTRKDQLVRDTARTARASGQPTSVRIHGRDGRIQQERTYPRGSDPRKSKG